MASADAPAPSRSIRTRWTRSSPGTTGQSDGVWEMYEIYLVARGESTAMVDGEAVVLRAGDLLVVEPGEVHTFVTSSEDYLHFVVQAPFVAGDKRSP
jgi:mannose-6-phosphate isomerase-like protein (cupin superfamily)